ncbi:MAG TPA: hypothetical protein VIS94_17400 [Desulfomonilia bacterium]
MNKTKEDKPKVGIIFSVEGQVLIDSTSVNEAEKTSDYIDHPRAHSEFWEALQEVCLSEGIRHTITETDYDYYPRGRVVYSIKDRMFFVYLDRCIIDNHELVDEIISRMNLSKKRCRVTTDFHYQCAFCNRNYVLSR